MLFLLQYNLPKLIKIQFYDIVI